MFQALASAAANLSTQEAEVVTAFLTRATDAMRTLL